MLNEILASHTGKDIGDIEKDTERDFFMSAPQAQEYGCVDEIIKKPPVEDVVEDL